MGDHVTHGAVVTVVVLQFRHCVRFRFWTARAVQLVLKADHETTAPNGDRINHVKIVEPIVFETKVSINVFHEQGFKRALSCSTM